MGPRVHALCIRDVERGQDAPAGHGQHPARPGEPSGPSGGRAGLAARPFGQPEITAATNAHEKSRGHPGFFYGIGKIFHNIFYYFLPCAHPHATAGTRRTRTGHGFSGSRGGACPHSCTSSHLFCLSGRRCQVEQNSLGTSLFGHVGLWFYYYRVKGRTLPS